MSPRILRHCEAEWLMIHGDPSANGHPSKEPLFLIKEESGVELCVDLLVLIVAGLQQIGDAMKITSF
jgi:hypothetical protein